MSKKAELEARRKVLIADIRKQGDEYEARKKENKPAWPDATRDAWDKVNNEFDGVEKELKEIDDAAAVSARVQHIVESEQRSTRNGKQLPGLDDHVPGDTEHTYGDLGLRDRSEAAAVATRERQRRCVFRAWMLAQQAPELIDDEMRDACKALRFDPAGHKMLCRTPDTNSVRAMAARVKYMSPDERINLLLGGEQRALSKVTATAGPELVPASFGTQLELAILTYGGMLAAVTQTFTDTGEDTSLPYGDDTSNAGAWVGAEGTNVQGQGTPDPAFRRQTWGAFELTSRFILVPRQLLEDAFVNLEMEIANMIGERIGRTMNLSATSGNATNQMTGIVNVTAGLGAPAGSTTAAAAAITYDDLVNLQHSIDPAIRPFGAYMFHDNILRALRLLKDTTGRPLWQPSMAAGAPATLNDAPYVINQDMASTIATTNITAVYGRLSDYVVRRVRQVEVMKLSERFAELLQYGFLGYTRADGKLRRPTADARATVKRMTQA
jgi:HK97 family phage major capsid protein